jgi:MFS family permease
MRTARNIRLIEAHALFANMLFVIPVILPFYRDRMGLSFDDFLFGEACFAGTLVLLDVPAGWISDAWKRKYVMALGSALEAAGFAMLLFAHGLAMAASAQIVIGIGCSLISGTNTALLYESLLAEGREGEYRRREGRRGGIYLYSCAFAGLTGGLIYPHSHTLPVVLCVIMQVVAVGVAFLLDEPKRTRRRVEKHPVLDVIETSRYALSHPEIGFLLVFAAVMFCTTKTIMWTQQPYYIALGIPESWFGMLMAVGWLLGGTSSALAHLLDGKTTAFRALFIAWAAATIVCLGAAAHLGWSGVVLLMFGGTCIYGMTAPRVGEMMNRYVDSDRRATVLSTQSLLISLLFIPLSRGMGYASNAHGVQGVLVLLAAWLGVAGTCLALWSAWRERVKLRAAC